MKVSVIMTCHNEELYIEEAIRSVVKQTYYDNICEVIMINDGSDDGSKLILDKLENEISKFSVIETTSIGVAAARNIALEKVSGDVIAILDGDDYWVTNKLEEQLSVFEKDPRIGLVYSDFFDFSERDASDARLITVRRFDYNSERHLYDYFINDGPIMPSTILVLRKVFDDVGGFDENLRVGEDTDFCLRVAEKWRYCYVPGGLVYKRRRKGQLTQNLETLLPNAEIITKRYIDRNPRLEKYAGRRMARLYVKVSIYFSEKNDKKNALSHAFKALTLSWGYGRAWINVFILILPSSVMQPLYRLAKRFYHSFRKLSVR